MNLNKDVVSVINGFLTPVDILSFGRTRKSYFNYIWVSLMKYYYPNSLIPQNSPNIKQQLRIALYYRIMITNISEKKNKLHTYNTRPDVDMRLYGFADIRESEEALSYLKEYNGIWEEVHGIEKLKDYDYYFDTCRNWVTKYRSKKFPPFKL